MSMIFFLKKSNLVYSVESFSLKTLGKDQELSTLPCLQPHGNAFSEMKPKTHAGT